MSSDELKALGNKAFSAGSFDEAIQHYTAAIAIDPQNHVLFSNRSGAYAGKQMWKNALDDATQCTVLNPSFVKGFSRKASAHQQLGQLHEAALAYTKALQLDPGNDTFAAELSSINQTLAYREQQEAMMNPFGGDIFAKLAKHPTTKGLSQQSFVKDALLEIQKNPQNINRYAENPSIMMCVQALMGISPEEQQKMAFEEYEREQKRKAAEEKRKDQEVFFRGPKVEKQKEEPKVEEEEIVDEELLKERRERAELRKKADEVKEEGAKLYKAKDFDGAIALFNKAFEIDPSCAVYLMNVAACEFEQQKYTECIATCEKALQVDKITPNQKSKSLARMAAAFAKQKEYEKAIQTYKRAILEDNNPQARQGLRQAEADWKQYKIESYYDDEKSEEAKNLGNELYAKQEYAKAVDAYNDSIARNPNNVRAWSNLSLVYLKMGIFEKSLQAADKALSFDPKNGKVLVRKGKVLHCLKHYSAAMECYQQALEADPTNVEAQEGMMTTQRTIYAPGNSSPEADEARVQAALRNDPGLALALQSPQTQKLLQDMQTDPMKAQEAMTNPQTAELIQKLIAAGIIKLG